MNSGKLDGFLTVLKIFFPIGEFNQFTFYVISDLFELISTILFCVCVCFFSFLLLFYHLLHYHIFFSILLTPIDLETIDHIYLL